MKISISQSSLWKQYGDEKAYYKHIRECGFRFVDYDYYSQLGTDESRYLGEKGLDAAREMRDYFDSIDVYPLQAHAPMGEPTRDREGIIRRTKRSIECSEIMGVKYLAYHVGGLPGMTRQEYLKFNTEYVQELLPLLEKTGVTLCQENVGRWDEPFYCRTAEEMLELIDKVNHPLFQACVDTGHLSLQDGQQYETITALGSHLKCLHVQDNYGSLPVPMLNKPWRQDLHMPPLMGSVNFDEIMLALKKINYQGTFNMEPEAPRAYGKENKYAPDPKLRIVPFELCMEYFTWAHDIAEYILETYGENEK